MSKLIVRELRRDADTLETLTGVAERGVRNFVNISGQYSGMHLSSRDEGSLHSHIRRFFRLFLSITDDLMVLFTGKLCRRYHKSRHKQLFPAAIDTDGAGGASALHCRGKEGAYFKHTEDFTRCSVDGFNYEYREMCKRKDAHKFEESLDTIADTVENISNKLQSLMVTLNESFNKTVRSLLSSNSVAATQVTFNDFRHLGEAFSFQIPTVRSQNVGAVSSAALVSGFQFSRDDEIKTRLYDEHIDLSLDKTYAAELMTLNKHRPDQKAAQTSIPTLLRPSARVIVDSSDDDEEEEEYRPKLKRQQPLPSALCMLSNTEAGVVSSNANDDAGSRGLKRSISDSEEPNYSTSINAIKRPFRSEGLDTHLDTVGMEMVMEDPLLVYAGEKLHSSQTSSASSKRDKSQSIEARNPSCTHPVSATTKLPTGLTDEADKFIISADEKNSIKMRSLQTLEPKRTSWKCRILTSCAGNKLSGSEIIEFNASAKWFTGSVSRRSLDDYVVSDPTENSKSCRLCPVLIRSVLDVSFAALWRSALRESENYTVVTLVPHGVVVGEAKPQYDHDSIIDSAAESIPKISVLCDSDTAGIELAELAKRLRATQKLNTRRLKGRQLVPPVDLLREVIRALRECTDNAGDCIRLNFSDIFDISFGSKVVYLDFEQEDGCRSFHSLQYIYVVSALYSVRRRESLGLVINLSGLSLPPDLVTAALCLCQEAVCSACNIRWPEIALTMLYVASKALPAVTGPENGNSSSTRWFADSESETSNLIRLNIACNSNLLCNVPNEICDTLWQQLLGYRLVSADVQDLSAKKCIMQQLCFDFLLILPTGLEQIDLSFCFSSKLEASSVCAYVLSSLRRRRERRGTVITAIIIRGLDDYLSDAALKEFHTTAVECCGDANRIIV